MSFKIQFSDSNQNIVLISSRNSFAKIILNQGASLQELILNNNKVIKDLYPLTYKDSYISAILFPFVSRIKDGKYSFNNQEFQLNINEPERKNAIHGLVYDKTFKTIDISTYNGKAILTLEYNETEKTKGFPFTYKIQLTYILSDNKLILKAKFTNTSKNTFPFTYGWHPYLFSKDLSKSSLQFKSNQKIIFDNRMITKEIVNIMNEEVVSLGNKYLDDCFRLTSNKIQFTTPTHSLEISSSTNSDFLQVYTPSIKNHIAIEPVSGVSDSFNNKIGLKELEPGKSYNVQWQIQLFD